MSATITDSLMVQQCINISATTLVIYDHFLMFDDEIRYIWRGRKSWIFYLYITYRAFLVGSQIWRLHTTARDMAPDNDKTPQEYHADEIAQLVITALHVTFSEIFFTLRVYAITYPNKIPTIYLVIVTLARLVMPFVGSLSNPGPLIASISCTTLFDVSVFIFIVWYTLRNKNALKLSALLRTMITQATVYIIAIIIMQVYIQVSLSCAKGAALGLVVIPRSVAVYALLNPILTLRFAVALKKSADPEGGEQWRLKHFSTFESGGDPQNVIRGAVVHEDVELGSADAWRGRVRTHESQRSTAVSSAGRLGILDCKEFRC